MITLLGMIAVAVVTMAACRTYEEAARELARQRNKREIDELAGEIKRLRAQVALHIGKEKE